ncbi:hypothetical protein GF322_05255 [Candidatus Dependentiae bacterium]|nr:hypothetical protein [Candidatus Dependentiae bacterium]
MYFRLLILNLFFINCFSSFCFSSLEQKDESINIAKISFKRINEKKEFFLQNFYNSKIFRRIVYTAGIAAATGVASYYTYELFLKDENELANESSDNNPKNLNHNYDHTLYDYYLKKLKNNDFSEVWREQGFSGVCKFGLSRGISKGIRLGIIGVIISVFMQLQDKTFGSMWYKFLSLWNGKDEENFLLIQKSLSINIDLLLSFLNDDEIACDKGEIKDNYFILINSLESLIAFVLVKLYLAQDAKSNCSLLTISNSKDFLILNIDNFSDKLAKVLNGTEKQYFDVQQAKDLRGSFRQLNNQLIRFSNLCYSVFYEKK